MIRGLIDRGLTVLARLALRGFFRDVEVRGAERVPRGRPLVVVANHFYGFVDPVMLMRVIGRLPRFLAKSVFWRRPVLRPFLWLAGMIPVYRSQDNTATKGDTATKDNRHTFAAAEEVLAGGGVIGVFPEGRTHDEAAVARVHTGVARIALGAYAAGVTDLTIVAVGLTFDDKISLRSRVLAVVADPIDVDAFVAREGLSLEAVEDAEPRGDGRVPDGPVREQARRRGAVRRLTDEVARTLRSVAPDYRSFREAKVMAEAAEIALRRADTPSGVEVPLGERERLARRLTRADPLDRERVAAAVAAYYLDLHVSGLREEQVGSGFRARRLFAQTLSTALVVTLLAPFALVGAVWNAVPYALVTIAGHWVREPVRKGSARLTVALVCFPAMWTVVVVTDPWPGFATGVAVFLAAPVLGLAAVAAFERGVDIYLVWRGWIGLAERRALLDTVLQSRARVVDAVAAAIIAGAGTRAPLHDRQAVR